MQIDRLETHDRLLHFKEDQAKTIFQGAEDCLKKNLLSLQLQEHSPYVYIFAHPRTCDSSLDKRLIWQPRLTKPVPQTNSYLFRAVSKTDILEICWLIPPSEMWNQYQKGNVTESHEVLWSIDQYVNNKRGLELPFRDDLSDDAIRNIYRKIAKDRAKQEVLPVLQNVN